MTTSRMRPPYPTRQTLEKKSESAVRRDIRFFVHILEDKKVKPFANVISKAALSSQLFTTLSVGRAGVCSLPRRRSQGFVTRGAGTREKP